MYCNILRQQAPWPRRGMPVSETCQGDAGERDLPRGVPVSETFREDAGERDLPRGMPMSEAFSAESRLIHAGTDRTAARPVAPPLVPTSIYVSEGEPRRDRAYGR